MQNIFIIGAGTMGLDIAQAFASNGYNVTVCDISEEIIQNAKARLTKLLAKRVEKGKMSEEDKERLLNALCFTTDNNAASNADLVLEAIVERADVKKSVFAKLDEICGESTIFATNTSSISITEIASATKRPDRFIGMHFFNPATVMKLVEIIRGVHTSNETFDKVRELSQAIGKQPVEVAEAPGFVVNRILVPMINEAIYVYAENIASVGDIDKAMKLGANHPMGPLELADFIGLDVCLAIMDTIYNETNDSKYRACPLLRKMVRGGKLGKKTGVGFYSYN